jgi:glutamyl-tRNA reductase
MERRPERPLLIVDIAVPRDVDPGVTAIPGVTLLDLDDLRAFAERGMNERRAEAAAARAIAVDELDRYAEQALARQAAPLVSRLHERAEAVRQAELERHRSKLDDLDDQQRAAVDAVTKGLIAKLLHEPSIRLKSAAGSPRGERYAEVLRDLFDLP